MFVFRVTIKFKLGYEKPHLCLTSPDHGSEFTVQVWEGLGCRVWGFRV